MTRPYNISTEKLKN